MRQWARRGRDEGIVLIMILQSVVLFLLMCPGLVHASIAPGRVAQFCFRGLGQIQVRVKKFRHCQQHIARLWRHKTLLQQSYAAISIASVEACMRRLLRCAVIVVLFTDTLTSAYCKNAFGDFCVCSPTCFSRIIAMTVRRFSLVFHNISISFLFLYLLGFVLFLFLSIS